MFGASDTHNVAARACARVLAFLALAVGSSACVSDDDTPRATGAQQGELGRGRFSLLCGVDDALCETPGATRPLHPRLAVGSSIRVSYAGSAPSAVTLLLASNQAAQLTGDTVSLFAPGYSALLARTSLRTAVDFIHLLAEPVDQIEVSPIPELRVGDKAVVAAVPRAAGQPLGGTLAYAWTTSDPNLVQLEANHARSVSIQALAPGTATLQVSAAGVSAQAAVQVSP